MRGLIGISFITSVLAVITLACNEPKAQDKTPAGQSAPAKGKKATPQAQINPKGPIFFEQQGSDHAVSLSKGQQDGALMLKVTPRAGHKMNLEYPIQFVLDDDTRIGKDRFKVSEQMGTLAIDNKTPQQAQGTFKFSVCTASSCVIREVRVATTIEGAAPAPKKPAEKPTNQDTTL